MGGILGKYSVRRDRGRGSYWAKAPRPVLHALGNVQQHAAPSVFSKRKYSQNNFFFPIGGPQRKPVRAAWQNGTNDNNSGAQPKLCRTFHQFGLVLILFCSSQKSLLFGILSDAMLLLFQRNERTQWSMVRYQPQPTECFSQKFIFRMKEVL